MNIRLVFARWSMRLRRFASGTGTFGGRRAALYCTLGVMLLTAGAVIDAAMGVPASPPLSAMRWPASLFFLAGPALIGFGIGALRSPAPANQSADAEACKVQRDFLVETVPVWMHQVEAAHREGDRAVDAIAVAFAKIVQSLEEVFDIAQAGAAQLQSLQREALAQGDAQTVRPAAADEGREIDSALLSEMLALGIELEAAGNEVEKMAIHSVHLASNPPAKALEASVQALPSTTTAPPKGMAELASRCAFANRRLRNGIVGIQKIAKDRASARLQLSDSAATSAKAIEMQERKIRRQIDEVLVDLQFQDLVGQILRHVEADLEKLRQYIATDTLNARTIEFWQAEMIARFSTRKELDIVGKSEPGSQSDDVRFF